MDQLSERLQTPISTAELERRWAAVRSAMESENIDVLLMQNNNDYMGGYVKYFTDLPATNGYPLTVVFPRDDLMTLISQGPFGGVNNPTANGDGTSRGVKQWLTTPSYASCHYTADYDPELAAKALAPFVGGTIGLLGTYQMSFAMVDHLQKGRFSNSRFVDASDMVDRIKVFKSAEERELIRRTAAMQDGAMRAAFDAVEPGMRDRDIAAIAQCYSQRNGSENGIYLCASMPPDSRHSSASAISRTASSRRATLSRSWSRIPVLAACIRNSAALVSSARPRPNSRTNSRSHWRRANSISTCSSPARPARIFSRPITISCGRMAGRRNNGCTVMAKATIWSNARSFAATSR